MGVDTPASDSLDRARELLAGALEMAPADIADDAAMGGLASWDSLAHMRLIMALEAQLGSTLPAETLIAIGSLGDVAAVLRGEGLSGTQW